MSALGQKRTLQRIRLMSALGQKRTLQRIRLMSALPPKADIGTQPRNVRFVPGPEVEVIALRSNQPMNSSCFWVPPLLGQSGPPVVCIQYQPDRRNPVSPFAVI